MPRYGAKTYGRTVRKDDNDHFDDLWNKSKDSTRPVTRHSPAKRPANNQVQTTSRQTRSSPSKPLRMASSESSRPTRQNTVLKEDVVGVTSPKRRRRASSTDDPFSFSSDDDKSPVKRATTDQNNASDSNNSNSRQTRASLQFDNGVESRNSSRAAPRAANTTRSSAKEKSPGNQTLITQFAKNSRNNDSSSEKRDNTDVEMISLDDSLGSPNGSDFSSSQTSVVSLSSGSQRSSGSSAVNARQGRRTAGKLKTVAETTSTDGSSSQLSSGSASSLRGKTRATNSASQSSKKNLRTNPSGSSQDSAMKSDDDSDDSEVIISSTSRSSSSQGSSSQSLSQSSGTSKSSTSKPSLKTSKSLPPAKPSSSTAYDEFDFSEDDEEIEAPPALLKAKSAGALDNVKKIFNSPKKSPAKAKYNARSWNKPDVPEEDEFASSSASSSQGSIPSKPAPFRTTEGGKQRGASGLTRQTVYPKKVNHSMVTSLKCKRDEKKLYTVVRHVKGASDCQESGESQQYADDIEYLMEGLKGTENVGTRCLSTMGFVEKCSMPQFRMHMRAHGTISKVFGKLQDAAQDPGPLNMDLDRDSLWLLVRLLSKDSAHRIHQLEPTQQAEYKKVQEKLWAVFSELPKASNSLGDIETSDLSVVVPSNCRCGCLYV
eukprot:XP_011677691.1 PREDICTED: protein wings apart-like [Strongylocentrotus purpuratus]